ncbi:MAG: hypothetical protein ACYSWZ_07595 [Planctomycetota bacterium]
MRNRAKTEFDRQTASKVRAYMFCACGSWTDTDEMMQSCYLRAAEAGLVCIGGKSGKDIR